MADFFTVLASRSLGALASVQPRRVSRFEPEPGTFAGGSPEEMDLEQDDRKFTATAQDDSSRQRRPVSRDSGPVGTHKQDGDATSDRFLPGLSSHREQPFVQPEGARPQIAPDVTGDQEAEPSQSPSPDDAEQRSRSGQKHHGQEANRQTDSSSEPPLTPARATPRSGVEEPIEYARHPDDERREQRADRARRSQVGAHEAVRVRTAPATRDDERLEVSHQGVAESGQHITVSIGRIEVRAPQRPHPAPVPRPAQPQPQLSLADYLQRSQRGRR